MEFIDESFINSILEDNSLKDKTFQTEILKKSKEANGLTLKESAALLNIQSPEILEELFLRKQIENENDQSKKKVKKMIERVTNGERDVYF